MDTDIQNFYKNKSVFVTGGSGFVGIVYIEKLLRATEIKNLYILIRPKKGKSVEERMDALFHTPLFDKLHKIKPHVFKRVIPILGDLSQPYYGISSEDRQLLRDNVHVIIHSGASVLFLEPLYNALMTNVRATLHLIEMAKEMPHLQAFVHISTAFANSMVNPIEERYYVEHLCASSKTLLQTADLLGPTLLNNLCTELRKPFPNTYTFTKALAEEVVLTQGQGLPICIFRPAIVVPIYKDPVEGWLGNFHGPTTALYGAARGVLHVVMLNKNTNAHMVPGDFCANLLLAIPWQISKNTIQCIDKQLAPPPIYNFTCDESNMLTWGAYTEVGQKIGKVVPLTSMIWYPHVITVANPHLFKIFCFFFHTIPGYFFDFVLTLKGKKRRMTKLYRKLHHSVYLIRYFVNEHFDIPMDNTTNLWRSLSPRDKELFNFNMKTLDWFDYFSTIYLGMRFFVAKEPPETIPEGMKVLRKYQMIHYGFVFTLFILLSTIVMWLFSIIFKVFGY